MNSTQQNILILLVTATLIPLLSSVAVLFVGKRFLGKATGWMATAVMGVSFACSLAALVLWLSEGKAPQPIVWNLPWIPIPGTQAGWLYLGAVIDSLTIAMMSMVTGIAFLVHLYSIGYMAGDAKYERFFAYLSLFSFSMLGIVMANSIIMLLVFWELVGLTSYLLIGFWYEKRAPQLACKKAFVMNRIGDMGFLIGFGILFYQLGGRLLLPAAGDGNMFAAVKSLIEADGHSITNPPLWLTAAGIGLFFGAIGKSAQFPLHTWLPDAMEGPTPVSSIVHSATMVAAGVYLTARLYPILTPGAHLFIATIGLITLVMAACMALVMTDIKRVLAYSTLSQLGYMILGLGAGAWAFALFHLITHAYFKCCLFQCAGSVIHGAHHQQDMRYYGGLFRKLPVTAICYAICLLAIAGASIPFTAIGISGFYSKDGIIAGTANYAHAMNLKGLYWAAPLFFYGPLLVAYLTVFYMARSFTLTFLGKPRDAHLHEHAHEAPWTMLLPQISLAVMAILSVPMLIPFFNLIAGSIPSLGYIQPGPPVQDFWQAEHDMEHGFHLTHMGLLYGLGWIISLTAGVLLYLPGMKFAARIAALPGLNLLYAWAHNKFYFDELYDQVAVGACKLVALLTGAIDKYLVDGVVNLTGIMTKGSAFITGMFDNWVVDGLVNGAATLAHQTGQTLRVTQDGRIRAYVTMLFASLLVVTLVIVAASLLM